MTYTNETPDSEREITPTIRFSTSDLRAIGGCTDVNRCSDEECHRFIKRAIEAAFTERVTYLAQRKEVSP